MFMNSDILVRNISSKYFNFPLRLVMFRKPMEGFEVVYSSKFDLHCKFMKSADTHRCGKSVCLNVLGRSI
jgi:hypothetical protein